MKENLAKKEAELVELAKVVKSLEKKEKKKRKELEKDYDLLKKEKDMVES